jgi:WD40 repeat protein
MCAREQIDQFHRFVMRHAHLLHHNSQHTVSFAQNEPDASSLAAASRRLPGQGGVRLRLTKKENNADPCVARLVVTGKVVALDTISATTLLVVCKRIVSVWDIRYCTQLCDIVFPDLEGNSSDIYSKELKCCAVSPSKESYIFGDGSGALRVYSAKAASLQTHAGADSSHTRGISGIAFFPTTPVLGMPRECSMITSSYDGAAKVWTIAEEPGGVALTLLRSIAHGGPVATLAASLVNPGSFYAGCQDGTVQWHTGKSKPRTVARHTTEVRTVCCASNGLVASASKSTIQVSGVSGKKCHQLLLPDHLEVRKLCFDALGTVLFSCALSGRLMSWDAVTGQPRSTFRGAVANYNTILYHQPHHRDGAGYIISGSDDMQVRVWVEPSGDAEDEAIHHTHDVTAVAVQAGNVFSAGADGYIKNFHTRTGSFVRHTRTGRPAKNVDFIGDSGQAKAIGLHVDLEHGCLVCVRADQIGTWDLSTLKQLQLHELYNRHAPRINQDNTDDRQVTGDFKAHCSAFLNGHTVVGGAFMKGCPADVQGAAATLEFDHNLNRVSHCIHHSTVTGGQGQLTDAAVVVALATCCSTGMLLTGAFDGSIFVWAPVQQDLGLLQPRLAGAGSRWRIERTITNEKRESVKSAGRGGESIQCLAASSSYIVWTQVVDSYCNLRGPKEHHGSMGQALQCLPIASGGPQFALTIYDAKVEALAFASPVALWIATHTGISLWGLEDVAKGQGADARPRKRLFVPHLTGGVQCMSTDGEDLAYGTLEGGLYCGRIEEAAALDQSL